MVAEFGLFEILKCEYTRINGWWYPRVEGGAAWFAGEELVKYTNPGDCATFCSGVTGQGN
jgi:hypothetical protein